MATLRLVLIKDKPLKDGRLKIKIAVCHKQETSYINTRFSVDNIRQWSDGMVVRREDASILNKKLRNRLALYEDALDLIPNTTIYSCKQLKNLLESKVGGEDQKTFDNVAEEYINLLLAEKRNSYADLIASSVRYFKIFRKDAPLVLADIDQTTIANFKRWIEITTNAGEATKNKYLSHIKRIINYSVEQQYVKYQVHPFTNTKISRAKVREIDLSIESLTKIKNAELKSRGQMIARDLFLLSFYTGGMNLIDLLGTSFDSEDIEYVRSKTKRRVGTIITIPLTDQAREIVSRYINKRTGKLDFKYKFSYRNFNRYISRNLAAVVSSLSIPERVMFSSARKSFSQLAMDLGIPTTIIDFCLGHSDAEKGVIQYYVKVKRKQAEIAIKKVTDYLEHPENYKELVELRQSFITQTLE